MPAVIQYGHNKTAFFKSHQLPKRYFALSTHIVKFDYFMLVSESVMIHRVAKKDQRKKTIVVLNLKPSNRILC